MNHVKAFIIKFILSFILLTLILSGLYNFSVRNVFYISVVLGVLSYIIGDVLILRRSNNTVATIADFGLAWLTIWLMARYLEGGYVGTPSFIAAIGVSIFEIFFHKYVRNNVVAEDTTEPYRGRGRLQYQTEYSEELTPELKKEKYEYKYNDEYED